MKIRMHQFLFVIIVFAAHPASAPAQGASGQTVTQERWAPFQIALADPIQIQDRETSIAGMRLNLIYGRNKDVWGLDLGLWNISEDFNGLALGLANQTNRMRGLQFGAANSTYDDAVGLQAGIINGLGRNATALQLGVFNDTTPPLFSVNEVYGLQVGLINLSLLPFAPWGPQDIDPLGVTEFHGIEIGAINGKRQMNGLSVGLINTAYDVRGVQIGALNFCQNIQGLQIGFFNIVTQGRLAFFPVINGGW